MDLIFLSWLRTEKSEHYVDFSVHDEETEKSGNYFDFSVLVQDRKINNKTDFSVNSRTEKSKKC